MGALADQARAIIPVSWDAVSNKLGVSTLQQHVEKAKYELLGNDMPEESAEGTLNLMVQDYLSKKVVLRVIPSAIEYWQEQPVMVNTQGAAPENTTYPDRIKALQTLREQLIGETTAMLPDIGGIVTPVVRRRGVFPLVSDGEHEILTTPNPHEFPPPFARPGRTTA